MQAIGSDPNYRPGNNQPGLPVDLNGLLSTSLNLIGEGVKATTEIAGKTVATVQEKWVAGGAGGEGQGGWSTIATGAVGLWKQASTLIAAPTEDELKFPRPGGFSRPTDGGTSGSGKEGRISHSNSATSFASHNSAAGDNGYLGSTDGGGYRSSTSSPAPTKPKTGKTSDAAGWDDFDDPSDSPKPTTSSTKRERPPRAAPLVSSTPPPPPVRSQSQPIVPSSASSGSLSGKGKAAAQSGSQEDFFASFGV